MVRKKSSKSTALLKNQGKKEKMTSSPKSTRSNKKGKKEAIKHKDNIEDQVQILQSDSHPNLESKPQPFPLFRLPNEILKELFSTLSTDTKTLLKCCLVSKKFHQFSAPILWRHLKLTPWTRLGFAHESEFRKKHGELKTTTKNGKIILPAVRKFTLDYHDASWCSHDGYTTSLRLPNLETVEINCVSSRHATFHLNLTSKDNCRLLQDLYPRTMICRNCDIVSFYLLMGHRGIPKSLIRNVEELIFIPYKYQEPSFESDAMRASKKPEPTNQLKSITWLFTKRFPQPLLTSVNLHTTYLYPTLFLFEQFSDTPITIVLPNYSDNTGDVKSLIQKIEMALTTRALGNEITKVDINKRLGNLRFLIMDRWNNGSEEKEMLRWKEILG